MGDEVKKSTELFIFSREENLEVVMDTFLACFGMPKAEIGNQLRLKNNAVGINIVAFMPFMGEDFPAFIKDQKYRVMGHFAEVQECDPDIQLNFIHHISQSNCFIDCKLECFLEDEKSQEGCLLEITEVLLKFLKKVDGVLLTDGATRALNADAQLILSDKGESDLEYYFPFEYVENPEFLAQATENQMRRRNENMKYLFDKNIYVMELPVNEDDEVAKLRSKEEIVKRAFGTMLISLYSECLLNPAENMKVKKARKFIYGVMKEHGIKDLSEVLSPDELEYFNDDKSEQKTRIHYSWAYENLYALEWALGLDEWTDVTGICDVPKSVRVMRGTYEEICNKAQVRSKKEILDKADLVYRMDWACVDARIHRLQSPAGMEPGVVNARHKTLNWLICMDDAEWDHVDTST